MYFQSFLVLNKIKQTITNTIIKIDNEIINVHIIQGIMFFELIPSYLNFFNTNSKEKTTNTPTSATNKIVVGNIIVVLLFSLYVFQNNHEKILDRKSVV